MKSFSLQSIKKTFTANLNYFSSQKTKKKESKFFTINLTKLSITKKDLLKIESSNDEQSTLIDHIATIMHVNVDYQKYFTRAHLVIKKLREIKNFRVQNFLKK